MFYEIKYYWNLITISCVFSTSVNSVVSGHQSPNRIAHVRGSAALTLFDGVWNEKIFLSLLCKFQELEKVCLVTSHSNTFLDLSGNYFTFSRDIFYARIKIPLKIEKKRTSPWNDRNFEFTKLTAKIGEKKNFFHYNHQFELHEFL